VSHDQRISHIKFQDYWTKIFDYYGVTQKETLDFTPEEEYSVYSDQDFIVGSEILKRT